MIKKWLSKLAGTNWTGVGELWLDPEGNKADKHCPLGRTGMRCKDGILTRGDLAKPF